MLRLMERVSPGPADRPRNQAAQKDSHSMRFNTLYIGAAIALCTSSGTPAFARSDAIITSATADPHATITIADLNLGTFSGMEQVKGRIAAAASKMCLTGAVEPVRMHLARTNCYRAVISSGQQQLDRLKIAQGNPA
jgi:UrcA family protein